MLKRKMWIFNRQFNRPVWIINRRFNRPVWIIKVQQPIIYLYRCLIFALPVFIYALGIAFGVSLEVARYL